MRLYREPHVTTDRLRPEDERPCRLPPSAKPLKAVYIINDLSIGGAEMMLYKLLAETDRERFEPVVISLMDRGALRERIEALGIPVHTTRMKPGLPNLMGL